MTQRLQYKPTQNLTACQGIFPQKNCRKWTLMQVILGAGLKVKEGSPGHLQEFKHRYLNLLWAFLIQANFSHFCRRSLFQFFKNSFSAAYWCTVHLFSGFWLILTIVRSGFFQSLPTSAFSNSLSVCYNLETERGKANIQKLVLSCIIPFTETQVFYQQLRLCYFIGKSSHREKNYWKIFLQVIFPSLINTTEVVRQAHPQIHTQCKFPPTVLFLNHWKACNIIQ